MRIIQVTDRYPPAVGGVERHVSELSKHLALLGVDVTVLTTDLLSYDPTSKLSCPPERGVRRFPAFRILPLPQGLGYASPGMLSALRGADLVHAHGYGRFATFLAPLCRATGLPIVVTTHSGWGRRTVSKAIFDALIPQITVRHANLVIALTQQEVRYLRSIGVTQNITVVPNGVDLSEFSGLDAEPISPSSNLIFVGRFDIEQKGLDVALQALSILVKDGFDVTLTLIGPYSKGALHSMMGQAEELGVASRLQIRPPPPRKELILAIRKSNVLILPSRVESFPMVLLEAMACGTPIVASRVGGVPEVLAGGTAGALCEPGDPQSLAKNIARVLSDQEYTTSLRQEEERRVRQFDWDIVARRILQLYVGVLKKH